MLIAAATVVLLSGEFGTAHAFQATPSPDACIGMASYVSAVTVVNAEFILFGREEGLAGREPATFSAPDWILFAEQAEEVQESYKEIDPPSAAVVLHDTLIEQSGLSSSFGRSAASSGFVLAGLGLDEQFEETEAKQLKAGYELLSACPNYAGVIRRAVVFGLEPTSESDATPRPTPDA